MAWLYRVARRLRVLLRNRALESAMDEEMRLHLELEAEELMRTRGLSPEEARRQARVAFGGVERFKEEGRDARGIRPVQDLIRDVGYALRTVRRTPAFAVVAVVTLGLGIGGVTAMFTLVDAILLRPLPYEDADRLVAVKHTAPGLGLSEAGLSSGTYFQYRDRAGSLESIAVYSEAVVNLSGGATVAERVELAMVGPEFFRVLPAQPVVGRLFTEEEARDNLDMTVALPVLLSEDLWRRRYGGDPDIVGRTIDINTLPREVVGVLPGEFDFPSPRTQIWLLSAPAAATANFARAFSYDGVGRLRPGVTPAQAEADLSQVLAGIEGAYPDATAERIAEVDLRPIVIPLKEVVVGDVGAALWLVLGGMAFLLLVAGSNVASLFLVRAEYRLRETSVRRALGARSADLIRLFSLESGVLALGAAVVGLAIAGWAVWALVSFFRIDLPRLHEVELGASAFRLAFGVAVVVALLLGAASAVRSSRSAGLVGALKSGQRGATDGPERRRAGASLVAVQVALALTLLVGSALMVQSFLRLMRVDPGFDPRGVLTVEMGLPFSRAMEHKRIYDTLLERVRALPGVTGAAAATDLPLTESVWTQPVAYPIRVSGRAPRPGEVERPVALKFFTPGYFQVMRMPVIEGAAFAAGAPTEAARPVVISAGLARRLFPGESAVARRIRRLDSSGEEIRMRNPAGEIIPQPDYVIAGVVGDVRETSLRDPAAEVVYIPVMEPRVDPGFIPTELRLVIRTDGPPLMLAPAVREIIRQTDPALGVAEVRTLAGIVSASTSRERLLALLLVIAAVTALLLGAVGIYGVVDYVVRQRTQEIGIRVALGARAAEVAGMVLRQSLGIVAIGGVIGLAGAVSATRLLRSLLFEVSPGDPATIVAVTALLGAVAVLASLVPAVRAARVDPATALRSE